MNTHEAKDASAIEAKPESLNRRRLKGPFHRTIIDHAVERIKISSDSIVQRAPDHDRPPIWPRAKNYRRAKLSFNRGYGVEVRIRWFCLSIPSQLIDRATNTDSIISLVV